MKDKDSQELLQFTRKKLRKVGLTAIDERIMADMRGSEGAFWDFIYYLKHLSSEIAMGSDIHIGNVLRRFREHVDTESGEEIEGIRVMLSDADRERFNLEHIYFAPDPELGRLADELRGLIGELIQEHGRDSDRRGEE